MLAPAFRSTIDLFDRHYRAMDAQNAPGFNRDLGVEVRERLQQLDWLLDRVQQLEARADGAMERSRSAFVEHVERVERENLDYKKLPQPDAVTMTQEEVRTMHDAEFEIKPYTEAFYYLAGRVHTLLKNWASCNWYALVPVHVLMFAGMLRAIARSIVERSEAH
jgi:hypothetical protein